MDRLRKSTRSGPLANPVFARSVGEIITADHGTKEIVPRSFTMPDEAHPVAKYFSERARYNAATMEMRKGEMAYLQRADTRSFHSGNHHRPPNPLYFFELDIPYPVGYRDGNGSGMTYGWTPLAYLLYYERSNNRNETMDAIQRGTHRSFNLDLWSEYLRRGFVVRFEDAVMRTLATIVSFTDPPWWWWADLMWPPEHENRTNGDAVVAFEAAVRDFQFRWNCGEWFDQHNGRRTEEALRRALAI